ncbi:MAG: hypothetical protein JSV88_02495 [Candidatus Aminicenantes bacterium]|nr:MAG: hypothetical protein JSV88_02495 [Candidatus Aminicenantes bacterium]
MKSKAIQKGKITIGSILIFLVLFYGGFVAFKIVTSRLTKSQIKNEIVDKFGYIRGPDFTIERGERVIREVLKEYDLFREEEVDVGEEGEEDEYESESGDDAGIGKESMATRIKVEVRQKGAKVWFHVDYVDEINLILFKSTARYSIEDEVLNYN